MDIDKVRARLRESRSTALGVFLFLVASCSSNGSGSPGSPSATGGLGGITSTGATAGTFGGGGTPSGFGGSTAPGVAAGGTSSVNSGGQFSGPPTGGSGGFSGIAGTPSSGGTLGAGGVPPAAGATGTGGVGGTAGASGAAGAGGAAGGGGTISGGPYSPCPTDGTPCKILPLGDSITYGLGTADNSAYRVDLFSKAVAAGQHITYVGSLMAGPSMVDGMPFPRNNEGHSGWTIDQVAGLIPTPALMDNPDIILLFVGTNDMYMGSPGTAPQRLGSLIDKIFAVSDRPLLVVAQITPLGSGSSAVMTYNAAIPAIIQARAMAGKHIAMVDMFTGFSTSWLADGVHPNAMGNSHMADVWYAAIKDVLH
jgi:hypothetical protein